MELTAGTRLGPYEIQRRVGAGGMGVVYGAVDSRLGRSVAIKVLPAELVADEDRLRRFEKEARTIGALNHPNLVTLHDVGHHDGAPFLVTELLTGASLRSRLAQRSLSTREAVRYAKEIARGLAAAHGAGVVHRDIKPDNIFITDDDRIKLLDFGIAKLRRDEPADTDIARAPTSAAETAATGTGVVIGTPGYMAPEQLAGGTVDARTDLFALGVVLYEMLARRRPFAADTNIEESYAIMKSPPADLPSSVPGAVVRVVLRCLEKRPEIRFQTAADLAFALEALGELRDSAPSIESERDLGRLATVPASTAQPVLATSASPSQPGAAPALSTATRPRSRGPTIAILAALVIIGVTVLGAIKLLRNRRTTVVEAPTQKALPFPELPGGGPVYQRVSFHSQHEWFARFAPDGRVLYSLSNPDGSWEIAQADAAHATVLPLGIYGRLLAVSPTGELALMDYKGSLVTQVVGAGPRERAKEVWEADYAADGTSIAIVRSEGPVNIIEYPIGTEIRRHPYYAYRYMRLSPDGKRLAFVEHDAFPDSRGRVLVIDLQNREVAASKIYPGIEGLAWSNDGRDVWFSEATRLRALDMTGHDRVLFNGTLVLTLMDVARDGRLLFGPSDSRIHAYVGQLGGTERPVEVGRFDSAVVQGLSRDGAVSGFVLGTGIGQTEDGYATFVQKRGSSAASIGNGFQVALTPDGSAAILLSAKQVLQWIPIGAGNQRTLSTHSIDLDLRARLQVSADGKRLFALGAKPNEPKRLWSFDLAGGEPTPVGPAIERDVSDPRAFVVSGDGALIALPLGPAAAKPGVRIVAANGATDIAASGERTPLAFSPDGKALFTIDYRPWPMAIERIDLATKKWTVVGHVGDGDRPAWLHSVLSEDTKTIAFSVPRRTSDLYVLQPPAKSSH